MQHQAESKKNRWAVILGCSVGVGAAIARAVAREPGLNIFGVHRGNHGDAATLLEEELRSVGRCAVLHQGDAGFADGVTKCAAKIKNEAGTHSVSLLVHSISGASLGHFFSTHNDAFQPRQFEKTFSYLAHSFAYWVQALYEGDLLAPGSRLLGLTNVLPDSLLHNSGLIAAAKAALEMYVRHLALELGPLDHRVNLLKFATVRTPALEKLLGRDRMARLESTHREMIPAGRMCSVEEVARVVSLLTRDEAGWFNGATIDFTGGMTLRLLDLVMGRG